MNKICVLNMSSESVAESSVPLSAAAIVETGTKCGQPSTGQVTIKLDLRLHWWNELSSDISVGKWLGVSHKRRSKPSGRRSALRAPFATLLSSCAKAQHHPPACRMRSRRTVSSHRQEVKTVSVKDGQRRNFFRTSGWL